MHVLPRLRGAFSLVFLDHGQIVGVRDPHGFRPLCLGRLDNGWVLASESPALDVVGAHFVRELDPGEMVVIDESGPRSLRPFDERDVDRPACSSTSFACPDARLYGQNVHHACAWVSTGRASARRRRPRWASRSAPAAGGSRRSGIPPAGLVTTATSGARSSR
jgi:amidophosphoribosyltransferase